MKGTVLLTAVLLAVIGAHANAANVSVGRGAPWAPGTIGEVSGAGALILKTDSHRAPFGWGDAAHPAGIGGGAVNVQAGSASSSATLDGWMASTDESGLPAGGTFFFDSIRAVLPTQAAAWWFGSALLGLTIVARRRDGKHLSED